MKITVKVLRKHILAGECQDIKKCAVALALRDIGATRVIVWEMLRFTLKKKLYSFKTPTKVVNFMNKFDEAKGIQRKTLKPISFKLDLDKGGV